MTTSEKPKSKRGRPRGEWVITEAVGVRWEDLTPEQLPAVRACFELIVAKLMELGARAQIQERLPRKDIER